MALSIPGVDYAWGRVDADALRRAGARFAVRYVSHDPSKDLGAGEKRLLWSRGIAVGLVWESTGGRALSGRAGGRADANAANARRHALGLATIPVYFAVDFDARGQQLAQVLDYLAGATDVLGHAGTGVYGGYEVIAAAHAAGVGWCWQTYAWSGGRVHHAADLYQHHNGVTIGGLSCDLDRATPRGLHSLRGPGTDPRPRWRRWLRKRRRQLRRTRARERALHARDRFLRRRIARLEKRLRRPPT